MKYQLRKSFLPPNKSYGVIEQILANRGIEPANVQHFLNPTDEDILNPKLLMNVEEGTKILINHIAKENDIFILVDCDCDGYTSAAALINYLNMLFPGFTQNHIYYRLHDGKQHGLKDQMEYLDKHPEFKLIICPDSSSNDLEEHKYLHSQGRDVLVLDHHMADCISQDACIINNQLCDYPTKSLSGVGVVYKFCSYIDEVLNVNYADNLLDLVAVGCIGDMMPIKDYELQEIIRLGLNNIRNLFLEAIIQKEDYSISTNNGLCPYTVSFYIVPLINATIRMGTSEEKLLLFESMIDFLGDELIPSTKRGCKGQFEMRIEQACRNCTNIKNRQTKARDASLSLVEQKIEKYNLTDNKVLIIELKKKYGINRNISRLIANQLMSKYQQPVLVLTETEGPEGETLWEGSASGYPVPDFEDFRNFMKDSGYAFLAEGHANAFGCGIADEDLESFIEFSNNRLKNIHFEPSYKVDFIWNALDFKPNDILKIGEYKTLWGQDLTEPYIAIENIIIKEDNIELMSPDKKPTLKITLPNGTALIKFKASEEEYMDLCSNSGCVTTINIVGTCNINEWNGKISPQVIIKDYEITGKNKYYF